MKKWRQHFPRKSERMGRGNKASIQEKKFSVFLIKEKRVHVYVQVLKDF